MGYWDRVLRIGADSGSRLNAERGVERANPGLMFELARLHADTQGTGAEPIYGEGSVIYEDPDIPGDTTTTATISVGGSVDGDLDFVGDRDWYKITLTAGQSIQIALSGTGATPVGDTYVRIRDAAGNILAEDDDGAATGFDSLLNFIAETGGTYYIEVDSFDSNSTGQYTLSVTEREPLTEFTYDQIADQLTMGFWGGSQRSFDVGADGSLTVNLLGLTTAGQFLARTALQSWTDVTGVRFVETNGAAEITFDDNDSGAYASSSLSGGTIISSNVNISTDWLTDYGTTLNSYSYQTYIHEIGHALGLGHAGNYNGSADYAVDALYLNDSWATTVMSYFSQSENSFFAQQGFTYAFITTPMNGDIVAIQNLYGASTNTRPFNSRYGFNDNTGRDEFDATLNPSTAYAIVDSAGVDTLDYSGFANNQLINLNAEVFMNIGAEIGNVMIGRGTVIENAYGGSGNDIIIGNSVRNILRGNAGNDDLSGAGGDDVLVGGDGDDILRGGAGDDWMVGNAGRDTIAGGGGNDTLIGSGGFDILYGDTGNDYLRGAGGNDRLYGGADDDTLIGDNGHDRLEGGDGNDILRGGEANDTLLGGDGDDTLDGGAHIDALDGGAGNDILNGGSSSDILTGGAGSDTFVFDTGLGAGNVDEITDFVTTIDEIALDRSIFTAIAADGALAAGAFRVGTAAQDADDRIIYNQTTGELFYDSDGSGVGGSVRFAQLAAGTVLAASDFTAFTGTLNEPIASGEMSSSMFEDKLLGAEHFVFA